MKASTSTNIFRVRSKPNDENLVRKWDALLDQSLYATQYTAKEYFDEILHKAGSALAIIAESSDCVSFVLTGRKQGNTLSFGATGSPQFIFRKDSFSDPSVAKELSEHLLAAARETRCEIITIYSWESIPEFRKHGFVERICTPPLGTILIDLTRQKEALFKDFSATTRNQIRRASKQGTEIMRLDIEKDFDEYFALYLAWSAMKGLPHNDYEIQRKAFLNTKNRLVLAAKHDGKIIGVSTFRFRQPGMVEYSANVSRKEDSIHKQNDLLLWSALEWATDSGNFKVFSMAGSHFYLSKFGGIHKSTYEYKKDITTLKFHRISDNIKRSIFNIYRSLPIGLRNFLKNIAQR